MSAFRDAVKLLAMPMCPHCGELRLLEQQNSRAWWCVVCSKVFTLEPKP